jgi:hypothetical protein
MDGPPICPVRNSHFSLEAPLGELHSWGTVPSAIQFISAQGKKGAHGDYSDIDDTIGEKDAGEAIKFMRHYLEHVYVLPKQLEDGT